MDLTALPTLQRERGVNDTTEVIRYFRSAVEDLPIAWLRVVGCLTCIRRSSFRRAWNGYSCILCADENGVSGRIEELPQFAEETLVPAPPERGLIRDCF